MRALALATAVVLLLPSAAQAQSHLRLSYEMAVPRGATRDFVDRFSSRGGHLDGSFELAPAFHLELSVGWNTFNAAKQGVLTTSEGLDVSGKQFRYINALPVMGGFAFHVPLGHGRRVWAGVNGGGALIERLVDIGLGEYSHSGWQWGVMPHVGLAIGLDRKSGTALFFDGRWEYYWKTSGSPAQQWFAFGVGLLFDVGGH
jgi:hypothetical protein